MVANLPAIAVPVVYVTTTIRPVTASGPTITLFG